MSSKFPLPGPVGLPPGVKDATEGDALPPGAAPWEYMTIVVQGEVDTTLNKMGNNGWEVCALLEKFPNGKGWGFLVKRQKSLLVRAH